MIPMLLEFLSTPSARRATYSVAFPCQHIGISIHALREEGDDPPFAHRIHTDTISIHALREEGDFAFGPSTAGTIISIHALREEGDVRSRPSR